MRWGPLIIAIATPWRVRRACDIAIPGTPTLMPS